jgi:chlorite dismutase
MTTSGLAAPRPTPTTPDSEAPPTTVLGHFVTYRATPRFWALPGAERRARAAAWLEGLTQSAGATQLYLVQGLEAAADFLVWSSVRVGETRAPADFFVKRAAAESPHREAFEPVHVLWGVTRPTEYSRASRSEQAIDPFASARSTYLVMYPFTKTAEWYALERGVRQGMMNEHIRIGKQYKEISQLLLYSFGLQDQEFVVVYETEDLELFSRLVHELRGTEGRRYTLGDTPLHTAIRVDPAAWLAILD